MNLNELETAYESHRVVMYNTKGDKAVYHNKMMRKVSGNIYMGEPENGGYGTTYTNLYALYDGVDVGLYIANVHIMYTVEEVEQRFAAFATLDSFLKSMEFRIANNDHIQLIYVEFIKHVKPEMESAMWESRKAFGEAMAKRREEQRAQRDEEDKKFMDEKKTESTKMILDAINIIKNGGILKNERITIYENRYASKSYALINYLFRMYEINNIPIRTQGFVNNSLVEVSITEDGRGVSYRFWKSKNAKGSQSIYDYLYKLIAAVRGND